MVLVFGYLSLSLRVVCAVVCRIRPLSDVIAEACCAVGMTDHRVSCWFVGFQAAELVLVATFEVFAITEAGFGVERCPVSTFPRCASFEASLALAATRVAWWSFIDASRLGSGSLCGVCCCGGSDIAVAALVESVLTSFSAFAVLTSSCVSCTTVFLCAGECKCCIRDSAVRNVLLHPACVHVNTGIT